MPFDLNRKRREREIAIASEIADEITRHVTPDTDVNFEFIVPHISAVLERLGINPSEREATRIFQYAAKEIARRKQSLRSS